jgi:hypothetical protein
MAHVALGTFGALERATDGGDGAGCVGLFGEIARGADQQEWRAPARIPALAWRA